MNTKILRQLLLYRYRYVVGYLLFAASLVVILSVGVTSIPAGLSSEEMRSAVESSNIALFSSSDFLNFQAVVDLPYHLLQKTSITLLGLSEWSVRLPSILVAIASGVLILLLLRRWFKPNIALIAALIATTNSLFLVTGRTGTALVMIIFVASLLLLLATLVAQQARGQFIWRVLLLLVAALSLYTPLSVYLIVAAAIAGFLHPHTRYILRRYGPVETGLGLLLFLAAITPLAIGLWNNPRAGLDLLALPQQIPSFNEYLDHVLETLRTFAGYTSPHIGAFIQPAFAFVVAVLIGLGCVRVLVDSHSTRTYALLIWSVVLLPLVLLQPQYFPVVFVPAILFFSVGLQFLIGQWYDLFPINPYARMAGLIPLAVLLSGIWYLNYTTYFNGMRYSPDLASRYSSDLSLLRETIDSRSNKAAPVYVIVSDDNKSFYEIFASQARGVRVFAADDVPSGTNGAYTIVSSEAKNTDATDYGSLARLVVDSDTKDALRWRVYR